MIKVTELSENEIEEIGEAFADYNYADGEKGMSFLYNGRDTYAGTYAQCWQEAVFSAQAISTKHSWLTNFQRISCRRQPDLFC